MTRSREQSPHGAVFVVSTFFGVLLPFTIFFVMWKQRPATPGDEADMHLLLTTGTFIYACVAAPVSAGLAAIGAAAATTASLRRVRRGQKASFIVIVLAWMPALLAAIVALYFVTNARTRDENLALLAVAFVSHVAVSATVGAICGVLLSRRYATFRA